MDPWKLFCELTKRVVEDQNVILDVVIIDNMVRMQLAPFDGWEEDE